LYFSIIAYDYISTSPYGEALGLKPSTLHESFVKPYFSPKLILGVPFSVALNNVSIAVAIIFSFLLRIQGVITLLIGLLWVMCYAKAAPVQGNVQLLHDLVAPWFAQVLSRSRVGVDVFFNCF
jgi:type IV secretory pathway TrbD component